MILFRLIVIALLFIFSCNNTAPSKLNNKKDQVMKNDIAKSTLPICNEDRATTGTITNEEGKIIKLIGTFYIAVGDSKRYHPCNLPASFQEENRTVKFSGQIKEIKDHERLAGTPFMLTAVE